MISASVLFLCVFHIIKGQRLKERHHSKVTTYLIQFVVAADSLQRHIDAKCLV